MRFLGIDYGTRRIGLATGDELGIATPANDAVTALDRRINRGEITMAADNYALLQQQVNASSA